MSNDTMTQPLTLRLPTTLLARLDQHHERLQSSVPIPVSRSAAIRALLVGGLDAAEKGGPS